MKYIIVLGDGMADTPCDALGGLTPLEAADTPTMDMMATSSKGGLLKTVPDGMHPGSEVANMAVLGYDVRNLYEGRGVLEAASMGIDVPEGSVAMRCNLITIADGKIKNHSAGHISTEEAQQLIATLQAELGGDYVEFHPGVSYRHLLLLKGADKHVDCTPPHDVPGADAESVMPKAETESANDTAQRISRLIRRSQEILADHPVNIRRIAEGKDPANSIWPWSPGYRPAMKPLTELYPIKKGVVISAVDLIFGIGLYAGLEPVKVEGATGLYDTNYEGKAQAAINAIKNGADFVFLHIEASDEAGHEGNAELKKRTVEYLDHRILRPLLAALGSNPSEPVTIAVLPDHPTPCSIRTHTSDPVPFIIYRPHGKADGMTRMTEREAEKGAYGLIDASEFMKLLFSNHD